MRSAEDAVQNFRSALAMHIRAWLAAPKERTCAMSYNRVIT